MIKEIWKPIEGYNGLYQVSNMGRVKSLGNNKTRKEKILKLHSDKDGYLKVQLHKEGKKKNYLIHRLVAQAFIDNPNNLPQVNHKDEDKTNNCAENLEYCDSSYNTNFGTRNERIVKANSIPILQFTKSGEFVKKWNNAKEVERDLEISSSNIYKCCKGKLKSIGGYEWGYADDYERIPFKVFDLEIYRKKVS